jgi:hypothetical protein
MLFVDFLLSGHDFLEQESMIFVISVPSVPFVLPVLSASFS